jgi:hypothetical protein
MEKKVYYIDKWMDNNFYSMWSMNLEGANLVYLAEIIYL